MVVGASDLADENATPSKAHLALDAVAREGDGTAVRFRHPEARPDQPEAFDIKDYLTIGSVVNTVYALFSVPKARYRSTGRNLPQAPVLNGLLA